MENIIQEPELLVEEFKKTNKWKEDHLKYYGQITDNSNNKTQDTICWQYYNNKTSVAKFEYLTTMGNFHLPSEIRHIPLQRTNCDILTSQKLYRPFVYDCIVADRASMEEKYQFKIQEMSNIIMQATMRKHNIELANIEQIDMQFGKLTEVLQQQPQQVQQGMSPEQQQQVQILNKQLVQQQESLRNALPQLKSQFDSMKDILNEQIGFTERELNQLKEFNQNTKKDIKEDIAMHIAKDLRKSLKIQIESNKSFLSEVVVGRTAFYVNLEEGAKKPIFKALNVMKVTYPSIDGIEWIQDGPWVGIEDGLSYQQIVTYYGEEFIKKYGTSELQKLAESGNINSKNEMYAVSGGGAIFVDELYSGSSMKNSAIPRQRIWFKVPRKIYVKYSPNPYVQGEYFRKFLDGNKMVINEDDYTYTNKDGGYYINKKNNSEVLPKESVDTYKKTKGEQMRIYYTNDIYQGVIINREYVVGIQKKYYILRNPDRHSDIQLPVYGRTHAAINDQPYSIIKDTINLQDMYDLINYYRDLMLALSGPKTILYDKAFKPTTMTDPEWEYQRKIGMLHIQTTDNLGNPIRSAFNQWNAFDLTVSSSIQYFDQILKSTEETMGNVIGVPYTRKGQVVQSDQVGTYEMSLKQAALITELRFFKHDEIESKAFEACINYALKYTIKEGDFINTIGKELSSNIYKIPKGTFDDVRIEVIIANNGEQQSLMDELKQLAMIGLKSGTISYDGIVHTIVNSDNLIEFKKNVEYYTDETKKLQQQMAGAGEQQKAQLIEKAEKMRQEYESFWKQKEYESKQLAQQIESENNKVNQQIMIERNAIERDKLEKESALKMFELTSRDTSEKGLLDENIEARKVQNEFEAIKLKLETLINTMGLKNEETQMQLNHIHNMKKVDVDIKKEKKRTMEQIGR